MINHVRTLLLNVPGSKRPAANFPGEEFVPPTFPAANINNALRAVRALLFGTAPDRLTLNYRLHQYMTLLHTTELEAFVFEKDKRVTYWPTAPTVDRFADVIGETTLQIAGAPVELFLLGQGQASAAGQLQFFWVVEILSGTTAQIETRKPVHAATVAEFTMTDGLSSPIALPGSPLTLTFRTAAVGTKWQIASNARPTHEIGAIVETIKKRVGEAAFVQLFGAANDEPYKTFKQLWFDHPFLPQQLGGLLLALAYRTEERI